jgi:hypothetical protein
MEQKTNPSKTEHLIEAIRKAMVPHAQWDNAGSADAMLRLAQAKALLELGCRWSQLVEDWTFEDRSNALWYVVYYNGPTTFAQEGPTAGEEESLIFYVPTKERLARLTRPDWTGQYFID